MRLRNTKNANSQYCMPAEGVQLTEHSKLLTNDEIFYIARLFVEQGVRKIRLTGGEPTVRKDIVDIIRNLKQIEGLEEVNITTNGIMLTRLLVPMQRAGLSGVNISLDTLNSMKFEQITRRKGFDRVIAGIDLAIQLGYKPKVNCVVMKNFNDSELCDFVELTKERNVDVRFIEYMPFTGNKWDTEKMVTYREMLSTIREKYSDFHELPNKPNDTSKAYKVKNFKGQIGFITSMTEHFCGSCNRLRITADGNLKVCLFGNKEISLKDAIRANCSKDDLLALIESAVKRKQKQHAEPSSVRLSSHLGYAMNKSSDSNYRSISRHLMLTSNYQQMRLFVTTARNLNESSTENATPKQLTHTDDAGKARMVDVNHKTITERLAVASAVVHVGPDIAKLIEQNSVKKGDVLSIAQIAGIIGAKRTAEIIPLCHNIPISSVVINTVLNLNDNCVNIRATVKCEGKTGVEMEALCAVTTAALTIYDMCKAISKNITISDIMLLKKSGGKQNYQRDDYIDFDDNKPTTANNEKIVIQNYNTEPIVTKEPFYPTHI
ncbi:molybdenum cofactor biosynthesis protein 1 isoform X2 [Contarinia nasturtii]|uniref:molybdenum cofactor biosynthesis protein 1 isoform X2 n=1 Tax=Contarinia nasturtii TaxID=265458 RepID=UPI0012D457E3|nr:molybdenum cofactor biosynthesis protein 1 isoform X2 [Contarinia nasturtii]